MRSLWVLATVFGLAGVAAAQPDGAPDVRYWPLREINFPVPLDRYAREAVKPTRLHFHVYDRGAWSEYAVKGINDLDLIDAESKKRGFRYASPGDGQYDFALQLEYANGDLSPRTADLTPQYRVIVDTRPPLVRAARTGRTGIQWEVVDENLAANGVRIEARWVRDSTNPDANFEGAKFVAVNPRGFTPKAVDQYTWTEMRPGDVLDFRIVARDKANQETATPPIRLPGDGNGPGLEVARPGSGFGGTSADAAGERYGQPTKDFSNTRNLTITSKLQKVTRSGVTKSYLWVRDSSQKWVPAGPVKEKLETIVEDTPSPKIVWQHAVEKDGLYGFIVIAENAAGKRDEDPRAGDPAQFLIEVDTAFPEAAITDARVSGTAEPRVEISWTARDNNFDGTPIQLEYAATPTALEGEWKPIHSARLPNTGKFTWFVTDPKVWKFFLRIRAVDLAGNETKTPYGKVVIVDLDTPKATIEKIAGNGAAPKVQQQGSSVLNTGGNATDPPGILKTLSPTPEPATPPVPVTQPKPVVPVPAGGTPSANPPIPDLPPEGPKGSGKS